MTDLYNRKATYVERYNTGLDTRRDDIGTLADRNNRYKMHFVNEHNNQRSISLYTKLDIYMTLLEDGRISYKQFEIEEEKININLHIYSANKDHYALQKLREHKVLNQTVDRLRRKLERKKEGGGAR